MGMPVSGGVGCASGSSSGDGGTGSAPLPPWGVGGDTLSFLSTLLSSNLGVPWCSVALHGVSLSQVVLPACFFRSRNALTLSVLLSSRSRLGCRLSQFAMRSPLVSSFALSARRMASADPSGRSKAASAASLSKPAKDPRGSLALARSSNIPHTARTSETRRPSISEAAFLATTRNFGSVTVP